MAVVRTDAKTCGCVTSPGGAFDFRPEPGGTGTREETPPQARDTCPSPEPRSPRRASLVDGADGIDVSGRSRRAAFRRGSRRGAFVSDAPSSALRDARLDPWSALRCDARETAARGPVVRRDARCAGQTRVARRLVKPRAFRFWSTQNEAHHVLGSKSEKYREIVPRPEERRRNSAPPRRFIVGRWRKSAGSRFRAMAEPWSVRRARDAGEAFRPARKAAWEDHDDDASPASRDGRSAERSRRAASAAPAPRLGPIVALVTRRDRVQHVYCKRTNETVPCVAIRLADDTFDGLRVVLWRAHAAADVGAERRERRR